MVDVGIDSIFLPNTIGVNELVSTVSMYTSAIIPLDADGSTPNERDTSATLSEILNNPEINPAVISAKQINPNFD